MFNNGVVRNSATILRNLAVAVALYLSIFTAIEFLQTGSINAIAGLHPSHLRPPHSPSSAAAPPLVDSVRPVRGARTRGDAVQVTLGAGQKKIIINPHANVFNRPASLVVATDDYLGRRPHADTVANLTLLVERCRGTYEGLERMRNVSSCMDFLANHEPAYYAIPARGRRASDQDPQRSEYALPAEHDGGARRYPSALSAAPASNTSIGTCPGPVIPYHVYWTGPATWRVELFIKGYLYTQNLACARLWLWLDADRHPNAVADLLTRDARFAPFLPLVARGDIVLRAWTFPARIPLPAIVDRRPGPGNADGERAVADGVVEDGDGQQWLTVTAKQMTFLPVAVSDAVRFVVLHLHGGVYLDMDVLLLRDMRPLLLPDPRTGQHAFAERWGAHAQPGDYNTAIMSLTANSSLSSYLLRGGVRMGLNFHPLVVGRMAWKDGRNQELLMLETAAFDPVWTEFDSERVGPCTVPCFHDYGEVFKGTVDALPAEWDAYGGGTGVESRRGDPRRRRREAADDGDGDGHEAGPSHERLLFAVDLDGNDHAPSSPSSSSSSSASSSHNATTTTTTTPDEDDETEHLLRAAGLILDYDVDQDRFPATNRTLEHFFRGAWSYHIHNQPSSWLDVIQRAHDAFFVDRARSNPYGEAWAGPDLGRYERWPEFFA
ncbi:MAG: hypothetical protein M1826_000430 [Phylliscum demangeonii]|nr:MAG: hypothetical protein M1826_000430 [Phylliscum demangeonii]